LALLLLWHIVERVFVMGGSSAQFAVGKVSFLGYFDLPVALKATAYL
jgi:hypothetical protein